MVKLNKIDTMLLRMVKNSKSQFLAVLIIIIVGICIYTAMSMTAINMQNTVSTYYEENNFADLFIETAAIPNQAADRLERIPGVKKVTGRVSEDVPFISENLNERVNLRIVTVKGEEDELCKSTLLKGRPINENGKEALLVHKFAEARGIKIGDIIKVQIHGLQYDLEVVGIVDNPEYIYLMENAQTMLPDQANFGVCYVSEKFGQQAMELTGSYNEILISYESGADEDQIIEDVEDELDIYGIKQTVKQEEQLSNNMIQEELKQLGSMAGSLPILFLMVAGLILIMMLSRMVKKDRIKIGVLKAIGYSSRQVLMHYVKYALCAGILGGFFGSILGMGLAGAMTQNYLQYFNIPLLRIEFYYSYVLMAMVLSSVICAVSGMIGARGVLKITPADAMRADAPKSGKRILLEKLPFIWKRLSFSNKMVGRNIFRNKKRTLFVLTGVILTYGMMLFTTSMPAVIDQMMNKHFLEFQKMDYNISFQTPVYKSVIRDLNHIIDIDYMEGKIEYPFELANGNKKQSVSIIGLSKNTQFYSFIDTDEKPVTIPERGILLSQNLANILRVEKGDMVQVKSYLPNQDDVYLQVKGVIKQALGMNAYMEINNMGEQLLDKNIVTGVYVNSSDKNVNEKLIPASNIATVLSTAEMRAVYDEYMTLMVVYVGFMVVFSGILGFCIVYNATIVSLGEREMEFSSLRVLGFSKSEIFRMILKENNMIMIVGILLGIPIGNLMLKYSSAAFTTNLYSIDMSPTLSAGIFACIFTIGFILLAQLATYRKINRLDFLQALKNRES
ncbi:ABC transporter permease [Sinanaerobacter chloroacetimidivorans]|jgi:putative ABC transport system permease protein|uniref:FtsX-like permease family protein n=1 Tax=Sinanaerobacter chloroacetimidivorans TaxID=2818044 RepID=A0A8J8B140_9FIRM|nr:FtsX-like permease family protein [Sinanaerobacter chloroacetimidivorans]MBR0598298.1 FtsX-like permease family protein [Sinanaerobacter chloroacetimidivorans]